MSRSLSHLYGRLLDGLEILACGVLFLMMLMICVDVFLRNVWVLPSLHGLPWADEVSEHMLYLITMLSAPFLLRKGRHIRVDILLHALPPRLGWYCEWLTDVIALACCAALVIYGTLATIESFRGGVLMIKTLVTPEWWSLAPLPVAFLLLVIELFFRMYRLANGPRAARHDAPSGT